MTTNPYSNLMYLKYFFIIFTLKVKVSVEFLKAALQKWKDKRSCGVRQMSVDLMEMPLVLICSCCTRTLVRVIIIIFEKLQTFPKI